MFCISYKIIVLSSLNLASRGLTRLWPAGMGLKLWAGPGPNIHGLGLGLNSSLRAWTLKIAAGLDSNC